MVYRQKDRASIPEVVIAGRYQFTRESAVGVLNTCGDTIKQLHSSASHLTLPVAHQSLSFVALHLNKQNYRD